MLKVGRCGFGMRIPELEGQSELIDVASVVYLLWSRIRDPDVTILVGWPTKMSLLVESG